MFSTRLSSKGLYSHPPLPAVFRHSACHPAAPARRRFISGPVRSISNSAILRGRSSTPPSTSLPGARRSFGQTTAAMAAGDVESGVTPADRAEWIRLFRLYTLSYETELAQERYEEAWRRVLDPDGDIRTLVIRDEADPGKLAALAVYFWHATSWSTKQICCLNDLYTDESARRKGYAKKLILAVEKIARERDSYRVRWVTRFENEKARRLYDTLATVNFVEYRMNF